MMGNYTESASYLQDGLVLAKQIGHREQICMLLLNLGNIAIEQKHYAQAHIYLEEGLQVGRQIGLLEGISVLLINLGLVAIAQGNHTEAEKYFDETLVLARQLNRPYLTANALNEYGKLQLRQKKMEEAERSFNEVILTAPEGCQDMIALANYGLAQIAAYRNEWQKAQSLGKTSLLTLKSIEHSSAKEVEAWLKSVEK
jgi:tetratricopeptide (TPR) repeat protein